MCHDSKSLNGAFYDLIDEYEDCDGDSKRV